MTNVLAIEDDAAARDLLIGLLGHLGYVSYEARSGEEGVEMATRLRPDMIVLDLGLPDLGGIDVIRRLRSWTDTPIIVVSGSTHRQRKVDALDSGADDFLDKPYDVAELRARLRVAERRLAAAVNDVLTARRFDDLLIDPDSRSVTRGGAEVRLTETEWLLLDALSSRAGRVLTHRWLIRHVWGPYAGQETAASLRSHLRSLRAKLGDDAREPRHVRTESGVGYRWMSQPTAVDSPPDPLALAIRWREELVASMVARGRVDQSVHSLSDALVDRVRELFGSAHGGEPGERPGGAMAPDDE